MKAKVLTVLCVLGLFLSAASPCSAQDDLEMAADALVVRPACFVATIVGSALFVISLPVAATSHSIHRCARVLVVRPAKATFTRPMGDMEAMYVD
ncbi:MAG TPA: hypothetical protein VHH88_09740 [Verrucomicrobiae bacterium]|nr:hypothetical protein [Verrucomicrobiae bacterium]